MKKNLFLTSIIILIIVSAAVIMLIHLKQIEKTQKGFLEGKVTIGPLCPVEPCNLTQEKIDEIFGARKLVVYTSDKSSIVTVISLDHKGEYRVALNPGKYIIDINRISIDSSDDVPKEILIEPGKTIRLDIQIDTGIR